MSCAGCGAVDFMQNMTEMNRGTLVVTVGTSIAEMKKRSTFDLGEGSRGLPGGSKHRSFLGSARFDWQLPGTNLTFKDCNHYSLLTGYGDDEQIIDIQIGTAQKFLMWDELKTELIDIEQRLLADGWKPYISPGGKSESQRLKQELAKPPLRAQTADEVFSVDEFGGYTYFKGNVVFMLSAKRPPISRGENPLAGKEFTHFVNLKTRAKWDE